MIKMSQKLGQKGEAMTEVRDVKMNIEAIRMNMKLTRAEMAERLGITLDRYNRLASGESKLLATEFVRLHDISGIPHDFIDPQN